MGRYFGGAGRGQFMRRNRRDAYLDLASQPEADGPIKIMAVSTDGPVSELALIDSQGRRMPCNRIAEAARLGVWSPLWKDTARGIIG